MGQKTQQAVNTVLAVAVASILAERLDALLAAPGSRESVELALTVSLSTFFSVAIEIGRQIAIRAGQAYGLDLSKILGTIAACLLVVIATGCSGIPTSSQANVAEKVTSQGGAIACESGFTSTLSADGTLTAVGCTGGITWTDPPTTEESTGLFGAIGDAITGLLSLPARMIGGLAAGAQAATP
jgi:hypothetical protein